MNDAGRGQSRTNDDRVVGVARFENVVSVGDQEPRGSGQPGWKAAALRSGPTEEIYDGK